MKRRTIAIVAGLGAAVLIAALGIVAGLRGTDGQPAPTSGNDDLTTFVTAAASDSRGGGSGVRDQIRHLMTNDEFRAAAAKVRDQHEAAVDAWWDKYGDDPRSDEAVAAMAKLRDEQRTAMNALLEQYGVDTSAMEKARRAAEQARENLEKLMSDAAFRKDVNALRDKYEAAVDAWWDKYGGDPRSDAAREAITKLRDDARTDVEALLKKYDVELPAGLKGLLGGFLGRSGMMMGPNGLGGQRGGGFWMDDGGRCGSGSSRAGAPSATTQSL